MEKNQIPNFSKNRCFVPIVLFLGNGNTRTIPCGIANTFNKYFASIA